MKITRKRENWLAYTGPGWVIRLWLLCFLSAPLTNSVPVSMEYLLCFILILPYKLWSILHTIRNFVLKVIKAIFTMGTSVPLCLPYNYWTQFNSQWNFGQKITWSHNSIASWIGVFWRRKLGWVDMRLRADHPPTFFQSQYSASHTLISIPNAIILVLEEVPVTHSVDPDDPKVLNDH